MSAYPLIVTDRKKRELRFSNREELTRAASDLDTVTAGRVLSALHEGTDFDLWVHLYDVHHKSSRLHVRLGRVMVAWLNRLSQEGEEDLARVAYQRVGDSGQSFEDWWNERQIELAGEAAQPAAPAEPEVVEPPVVKTEAKKVKAPKKVRKKRILAKDNGPKESLGQVYVETRSFEGMVEDYYGEGSYLRECPRCKTTMSYTDFGPRLMIRKGAKARVVQPQCVKCRREASKASRAKQAKR